jgi:hypothetical protein
MGATSRERYAVASCHVERLLDDDVWARFCTVQASAPGGFRIAALIRPPDPAYDEDETTWLARARIAATQGPLGHHTHWTAPDHARPTGGETAARVRAEGEHLRELRLGPTLFCGGGWYTDAEVAGACAELEYVDCTPRASRPSYLAPGERWASLDAPAHVELPSGSVLRAIPTTHTLGDVTRALRSRDLPPLLHVYFHDTDLLDRRRRVLLGFVLRLLARRATVTDLVELAARALPEAPRVRWDDVART